MPVRISSVANRLSKNGAMLHQAKMQRIEALGEDHAPSAAEQALTEERQQLKEERDRRRAKALEPGPSALDKLVRTHHPEPKEKPKAKEAKEAKAKDGKDAKGAKGGKHGPTRAEKHAAKASALEAARRAPKKPAKPAK
jgi:hypothetical protein